MRLLSMAITGALLVMALFGLAHTWHITDGGVGSGGHPDNCTFPPCPWEKTVPWEHKANTLPLAMVSSLHAAAQAPETRALPVLGSARQTGDEAQRTGLPVS